MSRREFLKLLTAGTTILLFYGLHGIGNILSNLPFGSPIINYLQNASAQRSSWQRGKDTISSATYAALLYNNKIFYLSGPRPLFRNREVPFESRIFDPNTGQDTSIELPEDLYSAGITQLPNGDILLVGGIQKFSNDSKYYNRIGHGINSSYIFKADSESMIKVSSMIHGRSHPSCISLPDGNVAVVNGRDEYGNHNRLLEIYNYNLDKWEIKFDPNTSFTYCVSNDSESNCEERCAQCYGSSGKGVCSDTGTTPRMHVMPDGKVIVCGMGTNIRLWNPATGTWRLLTNTSTPRYYGTSFLLPLNNSLSERGRILLVGGSYLPDVRGTLKIEILDFNNGSSISPTIREVQSLKYKRKMQSPVILPNGKLVIFGASTEDNDIPVYVPEMFDPATETWSSLDPASIPRLKNHVSILLPDGRVWTAGGINKNKEWERRTEIFSPDYIFMERPVISGEPIVENYGGNILIQTPNPNNISKVSLVKLMSTTQYHESNQRLIWLDIIETGPNVIIVSAPLNPNLAPPGMYMIHILNEVRVPSFAHIIKIPFSK